MMKQRKIRIISIGIGILLGLLLSEIITGIYLFWRRSIFVFKYIVNELDIHSNGKANQIFADKLSSYILANRNKIFTN